MLLEKRLLWSEEKDALLRRTRGIGFQDIADAIAGGGLLAMVDHPHPERHPGQKVMAVAMRDYVFLVPCEVKNEAIELKTAFPSRKAAREWRRGRGAKVETKAP